MNIAVIVTSIQYKIMARSLSGSFNGLSMARVILEIMIIIVMPWSKYLDDIILARNLLIQFFGPNIKSDVPTIL